jgi:hypothetical protein
MTVKIVLDYVIEYLRLSQIAERAFHSICVFVFVLVDATLPLCPFAAKFERACPILDLFRL